MTTSSDTLVAAAFQHKGTAQPYEVISGSTVTPNQVVATPSSVAAAPSSGVTRWMESDEARPYQGRWVAVDDSGTVLAAEDSPSDIPVDIARTKGVTVLYIIPDGISLAG